MKVLNVPNLLALFRIALAPLMLFFLIERESALLESIHYSWLDYFAATIFLIACITDFFDGYIARNFNQITTLGEILDPLADKMLILGAFIGLMMIDRANGWFVFLILTREFFITGLRVVAASDGISIAASMAGKIKTIVQMIAIGWLLLALPFGGFVLAIATLITLYSGYEYTIGYVKNSA